MALGFFPSAEEREVERRRASFLERAAEQFGEGEATLEQLAAEFGGKFPEDGEGFPYDFAMRMEKAGIPRRFITDLDMQCVRGDLETLVNSFRRSYVFGGISRNDYYGFVDVLKGTVGSEYAGKDGEGSAELRKAAEDFLKTEPNKADADAFFELMRTDYANHTLDARGLFRIFKDKGFFPDNTRSFDFFRYELAEVLENRRLAPKDTEAAREESRLVEKLQEKGAFYVIEWLSLRPEYIADVLIAMHPDIAHHKDELRQVFSPVVPESSDARSLRQFLGVCRKHRPDSMTTYDGRRNLLNALSAVATKIFEAKHGNEEVITTILADVVTEDYHALFAQNPSAAIQELDHGISGAPHPYIRHVLSRVMEHYQRLASAKLIGVRPKILVK